MKGPASSESEAVHRQIAPVTPGQRRLWFLDRFHPGNTAYHVVWGVSLHGNLDLSALEQALDRISDRHPALRMTFELEDGEPVQVVHDRLRPSLEILDRPPSVTGWGPEGARRLLQEAASRPFDLEKGPCLRAHVAQVDARSSLLAVVLPHIVSDGRTVAVIQRELTSFYNEQVDGSPPELPPPGKTHADHARETAKSDPSPGVRYWVERLKGAPASIHLPADRRRPEVESMRGARVFHSIPPPLVNEIRRAAQQHGVTTFSYLLAGFSVLLHRLSGDDSVVVGVPAAGRTSPDIDNTAGFFVNALPIHLNLKTDPTFGEHLAVVQRHLRDGIRHQDVPFERLAHSQPDHRDAGRNPLFQVMLVKQTMYSPRIELTGLRSDPLDLDLGGSKFDLWVSIQPVDCSFRCVFEYPTDLFDETTIRRWAQHFETLLADACLRPEIEVSRLALLTPAEVDRLTGERKSNGQPIGEAGLYELFVRQCDLHPNRPALIDGDQTLSYSQLSRQSGVIARQLVEFGLTRGEPVAICAPRSVETAVAMLAVLRAGGAMLAIDSSYPAERVESMLLDSGAQIVLADEGGEAAIHRGGGRHVIRLDNASPVGSDGDCPVVEVGLDSPAAFIYTSGTEGRPKAVVGHHRGIVNRCRWMWRRYPFRPGEVCCHRTPLTFVDALAEVFVPLLGGVPLVVIPDEVVKDPGKLFSVLAQQRVSRLTVIPSLLRMLLEYGPDPATAAPHTWLWMSSGEALPVALASRFHQLFPDRTLLNIYGSSEVAADATVYEVGPVPAGRERVPVGRPIDNTEILVLDRHRQPVPIGVIGEVYVGGAGVAHGYHNRPDLTERNFIPPAEGHADSCRTFRTGDVGRLMPDGSLDLIGRIDGQVKIRGHRIELGEVEEHLQLLPEVEEAAVVSDGDRLHAYVRPAGENPSPAALKGALRRTMPEIMVPTTYTILEGLPRSSNGKILRRELPPPACPVISAFSQDPQDELERILVRAWETTLGIEGLHAGADFFELGGHSLAAVRLAIEIEAKTGHAVPLAVLFKASTVRALAEILRDERSFSTQCLVPIRSEGSRPPIFCVHGAGGNVLGYRELERNLLPDQPVYGLQSRGLEPAARPSTDLLEMAEYYVETVLDQFPDGPYLIVGHSFGGFVALEMARILRARGCHVALVGLIDTFLPIRMVRRTLGMQLERARYHAVKLWRAPAGEKLSYIRRKFHTITRRVNSRRWQLVRRWEEALGRQLPPGVRNVTESNVRAARRWIPEVFEGKVTLFRASRREFDLLNDHDLGWSRIVAGGVEVVDLQGDHVSLMTEPQVGKLGKALTRAISRALDETNFHC